MATGPKKEKKKKENKARPTALVSLTCYNKIPQME